MSDLAEPVPLLVVVLAAGEGIRMKSALPKVLHGFAGRSMLGHVLAATEPLDAEVTAVVVGHGRDQVQTLLADLHPHVVPVVQADQLGTAHAVRIALDAVWDGGGPARARAGITTVLVVPGDAPLLLAETLSALVAGHLASGAAATMLTSRLADPTGYGRVIRAPDGTVERVVEHRDAGPDELAVDEVSALVYAFDATPLRDALARVGTDNAQGEQYLPDVVALLRADGRAVRAVVAPGAETAGVNDRSQLAAAHGVYRQRLLEDHMRAGVSVVDPASTWVDADVELAADVTLLPGVHLEAGTAVSGGARIGPDCTVRACSIGAGATVVRSVLDGVSIGPGCLVGPYAYLRGGARLAAGAKVGTFVEVKNSAIGAGTKVPHLSYVGDATIGARTNLGASTIFANWDGTDKHHSVVGDDVRTGSDTTIVSPVHIGDGAYTGAGTVVRADVPAEALALSMGPQRVIEGWAARRRARHKAAEEGPPPGPNVDEPGDQQRLDR